MDSPRRNAKRGAARTLIIAAAFATATVQASHQAQVRGSQPAATIDLRTFVSKRQRISDRDYWGSTWGQMLRTGRHRDASKTEGKRFQRRFRVTPDEYDGLVEEVVDNEWWPCKATDARGRPSAPVQLLVLGVLRMLGRSCTFDDLGRCPLVCVCVCICWFEGARACCVVQPGERVHCVV